MKRLAVPKKTAGDPLIVVMQLEEINQKLDRILLAITRIELRQTGIAPSGLTPSEHERLLAGEQREPQ